ncbi:MAG: GIY-YIG nuclease family protein [Gammaproteobacteria bacterium]|nr:GIY-YIG nuclease family protein [Gammaproteobacteria bacterium]
MCYAYILRCADGSFYVGWTHNVSDRVRAHNEGRGAAYTLKRRPVFLMYSEAFRLEVEAIQRERQIKRWSAAKKESLIRGDIQKLKRLSKPCSQQFLHSKLRADKYLKGSSSFLNSLDQEPLRLFLVMG